MVKGDSIADKGVGSARQYGEHDAADLVQQGRAESGETRRVDGGLRLRPTGWDGRRTEGGRWRSGSGGAGEDLIAVATGATAGSGATLGARERMREGE